MLACWLCALVGAGVPCCSEGASTLFERRDDLELPPESLNRRAVELRVDRNYFDSLLEQLPGQIESMLGENDDGTVTFEIDTNTLPLDLPGVALGPFGTNVGFRDLVVTVDLDGLKISPTPNEDTLAFRLSSNNLPVRIENAVVFGDVNLAGIATNAACVLETSAPAFTTLISMDLIVALTVGSKGNLEPEIEVLDLDFSPLDISIIRDCAQPECSDQSSGEDACFECGICDLSAFGSGFIDQLQDILGDSFESIAAAIIEYIFDASVAGSLPILGDASLFRMYPAALAWSVFPELGAVAGGIQAVDLKIGLSEAGLVTTGSALEVALDISAYAPEDGCAMDQPPMDASPAPEATVWPELAPAGSSTTAAYDLGLRFSPHALERLFHELLRAGAACTSLYGVDITALLGMDEILDQGAIQLLFPRRRYLGDPDHGLRLRLHAPPSSNPRLTVGVPETVKGALHLDIALSGIELIITSDNDHGPTWISVTPHIELRLRVEVSPEQNLFLTVERISIDGLESGLPPATRGSISSAFFAALEQMVAAVKELPSIEINLQSLLARLPSTEFGDMIREMAPGLRIVGLEQTVHQKFALYFRLESGEEDGAAPANIGISSDRSHRWNGAAPQTWPLVLALTLVLISFCLWARKHPISTPRSMPIPTAFAIAGGIAMSVLAAAPACETSYERELCHNDADCVPGYICSASTNTCTARSACTSLHDCCAGAICSGGFCDEAPSCEARGCAVPGAFCRDGVCTTSRCGPDDAPCAPGSTCRNSFCVADAFALPCPPGLVFEPYPLRCANTPPSCATAHCLPGEFIAVANGPYLGPECDRSTMLCACIPLPPPPGPQPDGSLAFMGEGTLAWYDARYGDLVQTPNSVTVEHRTWTANAAAGQVLAGLPEEIIPAHDPTGWRRGSIQNGPDIGREISTLPLSSGHVLVAASNAPDHELSVFLHELSTGENIPIMTPTPGPLQSRPSLYLDANGAPCVAMITTENTGTHAITRFCPQAEITSAPWQALPSILLNTVRTTADSCPTTECAFGSVCATAGVDGVQCTLPSKDCSEPCAANEVCSPSGACQARVAPQDLFPISPRPLAVASGPGPVVAITTQTGPSEVLGVRWEGEEFATAVLRPLVTAGGRGVLSAAAERAGEGVWILLALDRATSLEIFRWDDDRQDPSKEDFALTPMPDAPREMARSIIPYDVGEGSQRWLVRAEPKDQLWMLSIDALGASSWDLKVEQPVLGVSVDNRGVIYGWYIEEGETGARLGAWLPDTP